MRFVFLTAVKDLTRSIREPIGLLIWIAMPAIITALVSLISGGGDPVPHGTLLVVDDDKSFASATLTRPFAGDAMKKMIVMENVEYEAGRARLDAGNASALLQIPSGFGDAFQRRQPVRVNLWVNPSQRIVPAIIQQMLAGVLNVESYAQAMPQVSLGAAAQVYLNSRIVTLQTTMVGERRKTVSISALFFPGMLMLAVFGLSQVFSFDWWIERQNGTLRRAFAAPRLVISFLAGKTVAVLIVIGGISAAGLFVARWLFDVRTEHFPLAVFWMTLSGGLLFVMNSLLHTSVSEQRGGLVLNQLVLFIFSLVGGTFFPFEMMPKWLAAIGRWTPNGFAVAHFKQIAAGSIGGPEIAVNFLIMITLLTAGTLVLSRRVRAWAA